MELLQLKYFCDAAECENFSKTAKRFGVPPSDISQSIRRLEGELRINLFTRQANKVSLNEHGLEFYKRIRSAMSLIEEAKNAICDDISQGRIRICINSNRRIVMQAIERFKLLYPDVEIHTTHFASSAEDDFDVIVTNDEGNKIGYERKKLISESVAIALRADSPLAAEETLTLDKCADAPFITMTEKSSLLNFTREICRDFGFEPRITIQSDDPFYVRKCVELGLGVAVVPAFSWKGQFGEEVKLHIIDGYSRDTFMYLNTSKYITRSVKEFCSMLVDECSRTS